MLTLIAEQLGQIAKGPPQQEAARVESQTSSTGAPKALTFG
jgi:hypothetical protein